MNIYTFSVFVYKTVGTTYFYSRTVVEKRHIVVCQLTKCRIFHCTLFFVSKVREDSLINM